MIIEHLVVEIPEGTEEAFLKHDAAIWTATLAAQPGFAGKETWVDSENRGHVHLIIRWDTREQWKSISPDLLAQTDANMAAAFGRPVPVLSCTDLEVIG